jgi:hypothetical protein
MTVRCVPLEIENTSGGLLPDDVSNPQHGKHNNVHKVMLFGACHFFMNQFLEIREVQTVQFLVWFLKNNIRSF